MTMRASSVKAERSELGAACGGPPGQGSPRTARRQVALLTACGLGLVALAWAAQARFPLLLKYNIQIHTLDAQVRRDPGLAPALALAAALAFGIFALGLLALRLAGHDDGPARRPGRAWHRLTLPALVVVPPLVAAGLLLLAHPTTSLDLYDYLYRGHMAAHHGANTFVDTPEELRALDRLYWYTAWRRATTAYGPLWELLSVGVASAAGTRLLALAIGFKLAAVAGWLLVAAALAIAARPGERLLGLYLWLWNPLVLWELAGAAHNDGWMLALVILALACLRRMPVLALVLLTAAALLKYAALLLWPVLLAAAVGARRAAPAAPDPSGGGPGYVPQRRGFRIRHLAGFPALAIGLPAVLLSALLAAIAFAPWWAGPALLETAREQLESRRELYTSSPLAVLQAHLQGRMPEDELLDLVSYGAAGLLATGLLLATTLAATRPRAAAPICAGLLLWSITACTPWFQPWYLTWPIGLLALRPQAWRAHMALGGMGLGALLTYPAFAALRPWLGWPGDEASWQALVVALIYVPPLALLAATWRLRPARRAPIEVRPRRQEVA